MNLKEYNRTINQLSDILIPKYFNGDRKKSRISISQLMVKFENKDYENFTVSQPISAAYFRDKFQYLCQKKPDLVSSIVYLNSDESTYLINDLNIFSHSGAIIWHEIPTIETLAAAEQIFQEAKQKIKQFLNKEKPLKKDTNEILKLIEPLSGAKSYKDIQQIYWILYCELRFTVQLLKPDKNFDLSFGFDKEWTNLRKGDVPLLDLMCNTNFDEYTEPAFRKNTIHKLMEIYTNYKIPKQQSKKPSIVSDSAIKIKMNPFLGKKSNNEITINNQPYDKVQNSPFDLLYYLLWLHKNYPKKKATLKISGVIPIEHINKITNNDDQLNRFGYSWNDNNNIRFKNEKSKTVGKINKLLKNQYGIDFDVIVEYAGEYYMLTDRFKPNNIELLPYDTNL